MRNSAWYHKLWRNKLDSLPVKDVSDASWAGMHKLLNEQMPVSTAGGHGPNVSTGAKLFKVIGYSLSVAVTASTVGYFTVLKSKNKQKETHHKVKPILVDSIPVDSTKVLNYNEIADTTSIKDSINGAGDSINPAVEQNKIVDHDGVKLVEKTKGIENLTLAAAKTNAFSPFKNGQDVTKRSDRSKPFENLSAQPLSVNSKVELPGNISQKLDSSLTKGSALLLAPEGFQRGNSLSNFLPSPISILDQNTALTVYSTNELRNASSGNSNKKKNNKKAEHTNPGKNQKVKNIRLPKIKTAKTKQENDAEPTYSYGITTGVNVQKGSSSFYAGIFGTYPLDKKWQLAMGLNINSYQKIAVEFTHPNYFRPDSLPPITIGATRKVIAVDIPLTAAYKLSKHINVKAGPVISFVGKQSEMITKIANPRDTLYHSKQIDSTLVNTVSNKVNIGFTGGISIHIKQFDINGSYQWLTPYKVSNGLGSFKQTNQVFRIGIGYRFK
ncbi:PorT family protein [Pedobacter sp. KBS0701]|uniref:outer membrane beta-barrel protein n=1 Tax=Pedobacter sp. KBS0701 TaxID=2578106 RepID=UPI00110D56DD|nr:outer membrane beta-barrel protein [Pedobacter sp. KBS0701]QDW26045.1 PorT family protein [Pedobacter sp. KBS0701]